MNVIIKIILVFFTLINSKYIFSIESNRHFTLSPKTVVKSNKTFLRAPSYKLNAKLLWAKSKKQLLEAIQNPQWFDLIIPKDIDIEKTISAIILVSDVDGVIRHKSPYFDMDVSKELKKLLKSCPSSISLISGSPILRNEFADEGMKDNVALSEAINTAFGIDFLAENSGKFNILGSMGSQNITNSGNVSTIIPYKSEQIFAISRLLLTSYLEDIIDNGFTKNIIIASKILAKLNDIKEPENYRNISFQDENDIPITPSYFSNIIKMIRDELNPLLRLINRGGDIELYVGREFKWDNKETESSFSKLIETIPSLKKITANNRQVSSGPNYLKVSFIDKGTLAKTIISDAKKKFMLNPSNEQVLTVGLGDSGVDLLMYAETDLGFHVGKSSEIESAKYLNNSTVLKNRNGNDSSHLLGTTELLKILNKAANKPFKELKYIQAPDNNGNWSFISIQDLEKTMNNSFENILEYHNNLYKMVDSLNSDEILIFLDEIFSKQTNNFTLSAIIKNAA